MQSRRILKYIWLLCILIIYCMLPIGQTKAEDTESVPFHFDSAFIDFIAMRGSVPTTREYEVFAKANYSDTYDKYKNDEFEWEKVFSEIKKKMSALVEESKPSTSKLRYINASGHEVKKYDFEKKGFPVSAVESESFFEFSPKNTRLPEINLYFINGEKFNFLPYSDNLANEFVKLRKTSYGTVDREVLMKIFFRLVDLKSKIYADFVNKYVNKKQDLEGELLESLNKGREAKSDQYIILGEVTKVEVYSDRKANEFMGILENLDKKSVEN